jgi:dTDP-4-amino-4,6-dideoxygalactose transaminase
MKILRSKGIGTQVHYIPVPMHPYYKRQSSPTWTLPHAFNYYEEALSLPCFYSLTNDEQLFICENLLAII